MTRVGILRYRDTLIRFPPVLDTLAPSLGIEPVEIEIPSIDDLEHAMDVLAKQPNVRIIVLPDPVFISRRRLIIEFAARHHIPSMYPCATFVVDGGLLSYGVSQSDQWRLAASLSTAFSRVKRQLIFLFRPPPNLSQ